MKKRTSRSRPYRQRARATAAAQTRRRCVDAFVRFLGERWFEDIPLDAVAQAAGVTVQTVIRRFGGKEGLLEAAAEQLDGEIMNRRRVPAGSDPAGCVAVLVGDYEVDGDLVMRLLAQESRQPALHGLLERGRASHRAWVEEAFGPGPAPRTLDALVAATDLYVWHLLRRDLGRSRRAVTETMQRMVTGVLAAPAAAMEQRR